MNNKSRPPTVADVLETKTDRFEADTFFYYQDEEYSYRHLNERSNAVANGLADQGISKGDTVAISLYNTPEYLYLLFGAAKLGSVVAPIDTRFEGDTLSYVLTNINPDSLIIDKKTRQSYEEVKSSVPTIASEYLVSESHHTLYQDFSQLVSDDHSQPPENNISPSDTFSNIYIQRNLTEKPKGVLLPHFSYTNTGQEVADSVFTGPNNGCLFTTLPMYSSYPIQVGLMGALMGDAKYAFETQFNPEKFWSRIHDYNATVFLYLGRMLSVLRNQTKSLTDTQNTVKYAIGHGFNFETDKELIKTFESQFDVTVLEGYGTTTTASLATFNYPDDRKIGSHGKPVSYADVEIVDSHDWPVPRGDTGEIVVRPTFPHAMMERYDDDPEQTVEAWQNHWIHTGDIGYLDEDGFLYYVANKEDSISLGRVAGQISSLEVESVINTHSDVKASVVLGVENGVGEEEIKAVVVPKEEKKLNPIEICEYCEQNLAYMEVPRYIEIRQMIPRGSSGTILEEELSSISSENIWDREHGYELSR
jgi:acyl-CoA synthetase (AMP-forming)/AMP-acid ligase II